ncbi:MAG: hypothetical protein CMB31_00535 [Euryarchaeota archaeon]|nr:hypothetical protein [Euryarchaeota archaeon]|tara:strand:- start:3236 stop:3664 length:429 start_codon:yes stop_codon:yes gene_type:complete
MNWKNTFVAGAGTGATLGTLVAVIMLSIGLEPPSLLAAITVFFGMIFISAFIVQKTSQRIGCCNPSLKQLIPISFLTFVIPVLGASFGAPNRDLDTVLTIIFLGTIGGGFWSTPFAIWNYFRSSKSSEPPTVHSLNHNEESE